MLSVNIGRMRPFAPYRVRVPRRLVVLVAVPAVLLAGCSSESRPEPDAPASAIPGAWLERTAEGWPESKAFGGAIPVLASGTCVLTEEITARGVTASDDLVGYGSYGDDRSAPDAYRYVCDFRADGLSAQLQVVKAPSVDIARKTVDLFLGEKTTKDQQNAPTTVKVGAVDVHVNKRWYPKPEYGEAVALFHDEEAKALVQLEVTSLDADSFASYTPQQVATDLMLELARA